MTQQFSAQEEQILQEGFQYVTQDGVRAFTVEFLAQRLGMSKKTIYKFFPTKEVLLEKILDFATGQIVGQIRKIQDEEPNPARQFTGIMEFIIKFTSHVSPQKILELKTRYPRVWRQLEKFRLDRKEDFYQVLSAAQQAGYVRSDLDTDAVSTIYINIVNATFQPEFFVENQVTISDTIRLFLKMITAGLFTEEGLKHVGFD